jgi:hypothetical protein
LQPKGTDGEGAVGIGELIVGWVTKRQEQVPLWQVFHEQARLAQIARINFVKVLVRRGVPVDDLFWRRAKTAAQDRSLTIRQFLDAQQVRSVRKRSTGRFR